MKYTSKNDLVSYLREQLSVRDNQAVKGLMTVFANQTESEQESGDTHYNNGVGFTPSDAPLLTSFAMQYKSRKFLSDKQMVVLKKKMPKYARQLIEGSLKKGLIVKENGFYTFKSEK